jgi:cytochrome b561
MNTIKNDLSARYHIRVIVIHWVSFLLIAALVPTGKILHETTVVSEKMMLYRVHIIVGLVVFLMSIYRSFLFFTEPRPPCLDMGLTLHNNLVLWVQRLFYVALLTLGVSGLIVIFTTGISEAVLQNNVNALPQKVDSEVFEAHEFMGNLLIVLFVAHVGGVALYYFRTKESVLQRIWFSSNRDKN